MVPSYKARQERETERQRDRETERQRDRETDRQRELVVSALGFKDDDGCTLTKGSKSGEKSKQWPGPHTAGTSVW